MSRGAHREPVVEAEHRGRRGPAHVARFPRLRRIGRRTWLVLGSCVVVLALLLTAIGVAQVHLTRQLGRIDGAFAGLTDRPSRGPVPAALNVLLLTTDRESEPVVPGAVSAPGWTGGDHVDSLMVVHLDGDRRAASVVTIPTGTPTSSEARGSESLGSLTARSTPAALVGAVESLIDVRLDHLAVLGWGGLVELVRRHGGFAAPDPSVPDGVRTLMTIQRTIPYLRGDLGAGGGAVQREQSLIRDLMDASLHQELAVEPWALYSLLRLFAGHLAVDAGWTGSQMRNLAVSLHRLRSAAITYVAMPSDDASLWRAVRDDAVASWTKAHPDAVLPDLKSPY